MKPMKNPLSAIWKRLLPLAAFAYLPTQSHAALLLYEGFAGYTVDANLFGQSINGSSTGFTGSWGGNAASQIAGNGTINANSLTFGSLLQTNGGSYVNTTGTIVLGSTINLASPASGTIWTSFLIRFNGAHNSGDTAGFEIRIGDSAGGADAVRFRTFADTRSGTSNVISTDFNTGTLSTLGDSADPVLATSTTYIMISSFTNVAGASGNGTATTWALTPDQFQNMINSPLGAESYLATAGSGLYSAKATNTDPVKATDQIGSGDFLQIVNVANNIQLDEIRMGTTLADVIPVPEPAVITLSLAGVAFLLLRKHRD
jgi:hypothetical protein